MSENPNPRIFQPPSLPLPLTPDLNTRFKTLERYFTDKFFPYLFTYFTSTTPLDQVRCNATLTGVQDGVNTDFHLAAGPIRLAPDGTPQAILAIDAAGTGPVATLTITWEPLIGLRNGVNQDFTIAAGTVASGANGNPIASIMQGGSLIPYTTSTPGPFQWTMSGQTFILGTPPTGAPTDEPIVAYAVLV